MQKLWKHSLNPTTSPEDILAWHKKHQQSCLSEQGYCFWLRNFGYCYNVKERINAQKVLASGIDFTGKRLSKAELKKLMLL